jgi:hypothetical protein
MSSTAYPSSATSRFASSPDTKLTSARTATAVAADDLLKDRLPLLLPAAPCRSLTAIQEPLKQKEFVAQNRAGLAMAENKKDNFDNLLLTWGDRRQLIDQELPFSFLISFALFSDFSFPWRRNEFSG